jgi:hypothetical protein
MLTRLAAWKHRAVLPDEIERQHGRLGGADQAIGEVLPRQVVGAGELLQRQLERRGRDAAGREDHDGLAGVQGIQRAAPRLDVVRTASSVSLKSIGRK